MMVNWVMLYQKTGSFQPVLVSVKQMWNLWFFFGGFDAGIRPYKLLSKQYDIKPMHEMRHSRVSKVMQYMAHLLNEADVMPEGVSSVSALELPAADKVFDTVFKTMLSQLYPNTQKRAEELTCGTIYNRLCKYLQTTST
ncbi:hypothetical protein L916_03051 [Phytophthora nicotianae]|uniref:Uncharacterized protein n=1 Tax=Phytophthora nicotianae TaxID=4792 RepID=W2JL90_PHYNI|nr:hypothetical protein L916_03051 [Phytophthora nicotianae]